MEDAGSTSPTASTVPPSAGASAPRWDSGERYVLLEKLGAGGMGVVWAAYDRRLDRKVALKLLHDRYLGEADQARLGNEARAMARLAHPNVVPVFDVGEREGRTFLTMEFVRGESLAEWLGAERAWREIVEVFVAVARGLAAAHQAGIVHRDVKPGNILLGADGRARIADFGVSRADAVASDTAPGDATATATEGLVGSPAYMAPEQLRGERADARCDQFGLCVALYEALAGKRPFVGQDLDEQRALIERGPAALPGDLPAWLPPVVTRGLAADPDARFPSMAALAVALAGPTPSRMRRWWPLIAAMTVAAAAGGAMVVRGQPRRVAAPPPPDCAAEAATAFEPAWSPARRDALLAGFAKAGAAAEGQRIADAADRLAVAWRTQHAATCRATRIDHTWAPDLGVLSVDCLDERRQYLARSVDAITRVDQAAVAQGHNLVELTLPPEPCGDPDFLRLREPPPRDPAAYAAREARDAPINALRMAANLGRWSEIERDLPGLVASFESSGDSHQQATVISLQATLARHRGDLPAAIALNKKAYLLARRHRDVAGAATAASDLVWLFGFMQDDLAAAADWSALALVEIEGAPMSRAAVAVQQAAGALAERQGDGPASVAHQEQALAIVRRHYGPDHIQTANALVNLAAALDVAGRFADAIAAYREAVPILTRSWGDTLSLAHVLSHFSTVLANGDAADEAVKTGDQAVALGRRVGAQGVDLASLLGNHGGVLYTTDHLDAAIAPLSEAHDLFLAAGRKGDAATTLINRGGARAALAVQRDDAAIDRLAVADLTEAARGVEAEWGTGHPDAALARSLLATLHLERGRCAAAVPLARSAVALLESDPSRVDTSDGLMVLGRCALDAGRRAEAVPHFERAARLRHDHEGDALLVAAADAWLGLALLPADEARARPLLVTARTRLATAPTRFARVLARVDAALAPR